MSTSLQESCPSFEREDLLAATRPSPEEQKKLVKEVFDDTELSIGASWFVLAYKWWEFWIDHVNYRNIEGAPNGPQPLEIENHDLLDDTDHTSVRTSAQGESDYTLVPKKVWEYLMAWYGGGPEIERYVVQIGTYNPTLSVDVFPITISFEKANSGSEPWHSIKFSRHTTLKQVLNRICQRYYVPPHKSRLWLRFEDGDPLPFTDDNYSETLDEQAITENVNMFLETKDHRGAWRSNPKRSMSDSDDEDAETQLRNLEPAPTASTRSSFTSSYSSSSSSSSSSRMFSSWGYRHTEGAPSVPGTVGLNNLGNTCFMNSALQCLSNTPELTDYFLSGRYVPEINRDNPLGMKGLVATSYANLLKEIWSSKYTIVSPTDFKSTIGKFRPEFSGFNQQDSQELIGFLLDGLDEDLNRCTDKPSTEAIESDGRPDDEIAQEAWRRYLLRHRSIIVDLFTGQYRSQVECPEPGCDRVSITFDPMMYLSVPLPQKNTKAVHLQLFPEDPALPPVSYIISGPKSANFGSIRSALSQLSGVPQEMLCLTDVSYRKVWSVREDYKQVAMLLDNDITHVFTLPPIEGTAAEQAADTAEGSAPASSSVPSSSMPVSSSIYHNPLYPPRPPPKPPKHVRFQIVHRRCIRYSDGFVHRTLFHLPQLFSLPIAEATNSRVQRVIRTWLNARILAADQHVPVEPPTDPELPHPDPGFTILVGSHTAATLPELPWDDQPFRVRDWVHDVISIDWTDAAIDKWNKAAAEEVVESESVAAHKAAANNRSAVITLRDCLELNAKKEQLTAENTWYCNKCKAERQACKQLTLWKVPPYLCIHLKRFQYTAHYRDRIDDHVDFPLDGLDLRDFFKGPQPENLPLYDLYGVSNHMGGMGGGHYTAYVRNPIDNAWYSCNDSSVHPAGDPSRIVSSAAYLLFYKALTLDPDVDDANVAEDENLIPEFSEYDTDPSLDLSSPSALSRRTTRRFTRATVAPGGEAGSDDPSQLALLKDPVEYQTNLPWRISLSYAMGEIGIITSNGILSFFKNVFLLDVALLPASVVAVVLLVSTMWDAFTDILFGMLSDRTRSSFGRRRPYLLLGAIAYAGLFYAFFQSPMIPSGVEDRLVSREAYYFLCYFLFKTASTVYSIPYYSLVAELTSSYSERTKLTSLRTVFSSLFNLATLSLWSLITNAFPSQLDPSLPNLQLGYSVAALLIFPLCILPAVLVFTQIKEPSIPPPPKRPLPWRLLLTSVLKNKAFLFTLGIFLSANLASQFVINNLVLYVKYILQRDSSLSVMMILLQGFTILSLALWTPLSARLGKNWTFMISVVFFVVPLGVNWLLDQNTHIALVYLSFCVAGFGVGGLMLLPWSMMGDCVDVDELTTGIRREGLYFGLFVLLQKAALAGALAGANYALDGAGYINHPPGAEDPYYQPPQVVLALKIMVGPVSCALALLSLIPAFFYPLTKAKHAALTEQLKEQRRFRAVTKRSTLTLRSTQPPPQALVASPSKNDLADLRLDVYSETDPFLVSNSENK